MFYIVKSRWSIIYRGHRFLFPKIYCIFSLKIDFVFTYGAGADEMPPYAAFHLGLHCLSKYPLGVFGLQMVVTGLLNVFTLSYLKKAIPNEALVTKVELNWSEST